MARLAAVATVVADAVNSSRKMIIFMTSLPLYDWSVLQTSTVYSKTSDL